MRVLLLVAATTAYALDPYTLGTGSRISLWQAQTAADPHSPESQSPAHHQAHFEVSKERDPWTTEPATPSRYAEHCFPQPLDHWDPENGETFCQRYWVSLEHYAGDREEAEPVYLLDGGETSGANRLPFMEKGILNILANATRGISIVLEHRYYGRSLPQTNFSLSTDNLRFLTSEQALLDSARFIQHLDLGHLDKRLKRKTGSHERPWIGYGGSYAGAMTAFLVQSHGLGANTSLPPPHPAIAYPNPHAPEPLVWAGIASSAVTHAQVNFPEYFDAIREAAPAKCMRTLEAAVEAIDQALMAPTGTWKRVIKRLFGLEGLQDDGDFAEVIASPLGSWQARNWDPRVGSLEFYRFCDILTAGLASPHDLAPPSRLQASLPGSLVKVSAAVLNYAGYVRDNVVEECPRGKDGKRDVQACFGSGDVEKFRKTGVEQKWRLWLFQVCENWGYFMPAPLEGPRIVSKFLTLNHTSKICVAAFPPGKRFRLSPDGPDVDRVNKRGGFDLAADRLAFIDGDSDPWRPATPQSDYAVKRNDTLLRPVKLIPNAVHHFDENGLLDPSEEPKRIRRVHAEEVEFVKSWLEQWRRRKD
ncbi:Serine carboxypeptidase S28 [Naganishia albida]|nr:Serine carboxypeptidase S28 [Naganishia albida]